MGHELNEINDISAHPDESGYFYDYIRDIEPNGPSAYTISEMSAYDNPYWTVHDYSYKKFRRVFSIFTLDNFVWTRKYNSGPDYVSGSVSTGVITRTTSQVGQYNYQYGYSDDKGWVNVCYNLYKTDNSNIESDDVYILNENFSGKIYGNFVKHNNNYVHVGFYPTDKRFDYFTIGDNKWAYKEKDSTSIKSYYSFPLGHAIYNNNYKYNYLQFYNGSIEKPNSYKNKYSDDTLIPNSIDTYYSDVSYFGHDADYVGITYGNFPDELVGSKFVASSVIDFDGSSYTYTDLYTLKYDNITSLYDISDYNWTLDINDIGDSTWKRTCKYFTNHNLADNVELPEQYRHAFLIFAFLSTPDFFSTLEANNLFKWELSDAESTVNGTVTDSRYWRDCRYIVTGNSLYENASSISGGTGDGGDASGNIGVAPYMVTRIGKDENNKLYMIYDVPLIPYFGDRTIDKSIISALLEVIRNNVMKGFQVIGGGYHYTFYYEVVQQFITWLAGNSFYGMSDHRSAILRLIQDINKSNLPNMTPKQFLDYYRAAVATVWRNMPCGYNKPYGTKVSLSNNGGKLLTSEIYIAINAPGAGGGQGEYSNPDDYVGHGGNCGSAGIFKITLDSVNKCRDESILCNIYSSVLGGNPLVMTNFNNANGTYKHPGFSGTNVYVVGKNSAYELYGGVALNGGNEAYNYDQSNTDSMENANVVRIKNDRLSCGGVYNIDQTKFYNYNSLSNIKLIDGTGTSQLGALMCINPYPKSSFTNSVSYIDNETHLITLSGLDTSKSNYNKWTCGVYDKSSYTVTDDVYYRAYRPGTPPIVTDLINNLSDPFHECSILYAANSIFADGGSSIYEAAAGDSDKRHMDNYGEADRENIIRTYVDGRRGAGGGALCDSSQDNGFTRSGKGGSMAFQLFWYSPNKDIDIVFTDNSSGGGGGGGK